MPLTSRGNGGELCDRGEASTSVIAKLIVWIVIGLIGGTLAGLIVTQQRRGFGFFQNLGLGLAGALIGGGVFRFFGLLPGLDSIVISIRDVIAAIAGSLLLVVAFWLWQRFKKPK